MNRLTNEFVLSNIESGFHLDDEHIQFVKEKLEYADKMMSIEKELGCPLEVVFKALKNRQVIYKHIVGLENPKTTLESHKIVEISFDGNNFGLWINGTGYGDEFYVYTKDYGKTWSLTKENFK